MHSFVRRAAAILAVAAVAVAVVCSSTAPARAAQSANAPPCARTVIVERKMPSGPAQYQSGRLTLRNGATLRLQGSAGEMYAVRTMHVGDPVAACYGPLKSYADAPPSRSTTVLDLANGSYYGTLIGSWKTP
ncbi:MAG: hypothetical protein M3R53_05880 [Candidatus Eremiobacteraeota bacterium]|nr:hypothetical protein [Candidatus Eremiobacteraeota bacterium]